MILIDKSGDEPRILFTDEPLLEDMERALRSVGYRAIWHGNKLTDVVAFEEQDGKLERVRVWEACLVELPITADVASRGPFGANIIPERRR